MTEFVECRAIGHAWKYDNVEFNRGTKVYEQRLLCSRCWATRTTFISARTGELVRNSRYTYPAGYLSRGSGAFDSDRRAKLRLESAKVAAAVSIRRR